MVGEEDSIFFSVSDNELPGFIQPVEVLAGIHDHGSRTSTTEPFLDAVAPTYALISCGQGNSYGHPTVEVLQRLQERGIQMYRTDLQGTVILYSDGNSIWSDQDPCQD